MACERFRNKRTPGKRKKKKKPQTNNGSRTVKAKQWDSFQPKLSLRHTLWKPEKYFN